MHCSIYIHLRCKPAYSLHGIDIAVLSKILFFVIYANLFLEFILVISIFKFRLAAYVFFSLRRECAYFCYYYSLSEDDDANQN